MELIKEPNVARLKRKQTECYGEIPYKVARVRTEQAHSSCSCTCSCHCCRMRSISADRRLNYLNSGLPDRIMFYNDGVWVDFSKPVVETLSRGFREETSSIVLLISSQPHLVDFLSMVMINLRTRKQNWIAWIDMDAKCFFPTFFNENAGESADLTCGIGDRSLHGLESGRASDSTCEVVKCIAAGSGVSLPKQLFASSDVLRKKIEKLERDSADFLFVQNVFLSGMGPFASSRDIIQIHKVVQKDNGAKTRLKTFEKQISSTKEKRDDANVRYAWFGSKKIDIVGILIHGFGMAGKPTEGAAFGTGVYLTPKNRAFTSIYFCDNDEKGIQYLLLCRVILGSSEQVQPWSNQDFASSNLFDSGVDNLLEPRCFVVWPSHMDSYIHPEYLISFALPPNVREHLSGLKDVRFHVPTPKAEQALSAIHPERCEPVEAPSSPWVPFTVLFKAIQASASPLAMALLYRHHDEYTKSLINREELVNKVRLIVGDQLLVSTLKTLQRSPVPSPEKGGGMHKPASWYDNSNLQTEKVDDCASPTMDPNGFAAQKTELNDSSAVLKTDASAIPTFDLNSSEPLASDMYESAVTLVEHTDKIKFMSDNVSWCCFKLNPVCKVSLAHECRINCSVHCI